MRRLIQLSSKKFSNLTFTNRLPKYYADVNTKLNPPEYSAYEETQIKFGLVNYINYRFQDDYEINEKVGRGKYSEVYKGVNVLTDQKVIIKILKPGKIILNSVKLKKILRETRILQALKGGTNIVQLLEVIKDPSSKTPSLILEYNVNNDHKTLYKTFNDFDIRFYIYELLKVINLLKRL